MKMELIYIIFVVAGLLLGVGLMYLVTYIARKIESRQKACVLSCVAGVTLVTVLLAVAYWLLPAVITGVMI